MCISCIIIYLRIRSSTLCCSQWHAVSTEISILSELSTSTTANTEQLLLNEVPDDEYRHIVQMLNKEQKEFFYHMLPVLGKISLRFLLIH